MSLEHETLRYKSEKCLLNLREQNYVLIIISVCSFVLEVFKFFCLNLQ